jgi:hypothetical protein
MALAIDLLPRLIGFVIVIMGVDTLRRTKRMTAGPDLAERAGFEPAIPFWSILTFQASAFDHSATSPQT